MGYGVDGNSVRQSREDRDAWQKYAEKLERQIAAKESSSSYSSSSYSPFDEIQKAIRESNEEALHDTTPYDEHAEYLSRMFSLLSDYNTNVRIRLNIIFFVKASYASFGNLKRKYLNKAVKISNEREYNLKLIAEGEFDLHSIFDTSQRTHFSSVLLLELIKKMEPIEQNLELVNEVNELNKSASFMLDNYRTNFIENRIKELQDADMFSARPFSYFPDESKIPPCSQREKYFEAGKKWKNISDFRDRDEYVAYETKIKFSNW